MECFVMSGLVLRVASWNCKIMQVRWSFTCCLSWTLSSSSKCSQLKSFLQSFLLFSGRCSSELALLVPLRYSQGRSAGYSDRLHEFFITIPRCYKNVYVNSLFPRTDRPWNSLPIECFPLNYSLNGFKSRINRHLLTADSF